MKILLQVCEKRSKGRNSVHTRLFSETVSVKKYHEHFVVASFLVCQSLANTVCPESHMESDIYLGNFKSSC